MLCAILLTGPFELMTRFEGLEGYSPLVTDPLLIGGAYRKAMAAFCQSVEQGCKQLNFDYYRMRTDESLAATLPTMLSSRMIRRV